MSMVEWWWLALGIFAAVVVVVAVLLGLVIAAAKSIDTHARRIWSEGKQIAGNTVSVWMLEDANRNLESVLDSVPDLTRSMDGMTEALEALSRRGRS